MNDTPAKVWHAVDVLAERSTVEAIESALNERGALGTEINGLRKRPDEPLCVTGFFDVPADTSIVREAVASEFAIYGFDLSSVLGVFGRVVEETDWLAEWKKHWRPTEVGRFVIAPPWSDVFDESKIVIRVEPNMAFGTGTHETTQLCIDAIDTIYEPTMSMLDVGTGTGILAIAAAKLGGSTILACDTDLDSVKIARENAVLNGVAARIEFADGPIDANTPQFDFVCANLTLDVISPLLPLLLAKTKCWLILSGILVSQEPEIVEQLKLSKIQDTDIRHSGEWISVAIKLN